MDNKKMDPVTAEKRAANRDPITGAPGSHPVGTGVGSVGGAAAGAAVGAVVGGPVGALVGGVVGAVTGGATGHAVGEAVDPTVELAYWKANYSKRPYYKPGKTFADYEPAYRFGWETACKVEYRGRDWKALETDMERDWNKARGTNRESWNDMRDATHDAWTRCNRAPGV